MSQQYPTTVGSNHAFGAIPKQQGNLNFAGQPINYSPNQGMQAFNQGSANIGNQALDMSGGANSAFAFDGGMNNQGGGSAFSMPSLGQIGAGIGIGADLFGMYNAHKGMKLAKEQLGMQKKAYKDNVANRDRFIGNTQQAFA